MELFVRRSDSVPSAAVPSIGPDEHETNSALNNHYSRLEDPAAQEADGADAIPEVPGYDIAGRLGRGGMGTVWRATQLGPSRQVALKLLGAASFGSDRARQRFEREVELAARLEHPQIARIYDSGCHRGSCYYAMELIDGPQLDEYVKQQMPDRGQILRLLREVCLAVQYAHQRGVIHRDLKPSNILVTADGQPHVVDFGLAKAIADDGLNPTLTQDGQYAGTPAFMSPEQAAGRWEHLDTRTDVYALGATLYLLLVGQSPHDQQGAWYEVLRRVADEDVRRPRQLNRHFDAELEAILLKALDRDPERRYASASDLAQDIERYLKGEPLHAAPRSARYRLRKFMGRHRVPLCVGAGLSLLLLVATVVSTWQAVRATRASNAEARQRGVAQQATAKETAQRRHAEAVGHFLESVLRGLVPSEGVIRLLERTRDQQIKQVGPEHPSTLNTLHVLARDYDRLGRHDQAIVLFERARVGRVKVLGPNHPDTLATVQGLASACQSSGRMSDAIKLFEQVREERVKRLGPAHADALSATEDLVYAYRCAGRAAEAITLSEQVRVAMEHSLQERSAALVRKPSESGLWNDRASLNARLGNFAQAVGDFDHCIGLDPSNEYAWYHMGCLVAYLGEKQAYVKASTEMMKRFADDSDWTHLEQTAKVACLLRDSPVNPRQPVELTRQALATAGNDTGANLPDAKRWMLMTEGIALYRCGEYRAALEPLEASKSPDNLERTLTAVVFQAMALWQLGEQDGAVVRLREARKRSDRNLPTPGQSDLGHNASENWVILQIALREANALLGFDDVFAP